MHGFSTLGSCPVFHLFLIYLHFLILGLFSLLSLTSFSFQYSYFIFHLLQTLLSSCPVGRRVITTSLTLFLYSSPKTLIKVRLTEPRVEQPHLQIPRLGATEMTATVPNSVYVICSKTIHIKKNCKIKTLNFSYFSPLSQQIIFIPIVTPLLLFLC